ncbi:MAG: T9SS type A sorting domain-containing protein [Saprospiraceae bacterium]|nr:T9SS type A sorting domain-containing protein [Saprospiraceae bacterium]MCB9325042.1 T9SS type A sorting domain-containing protein [Lewinellaceae bacterium]
MKFFTTLSFLLLLFSLSAQVNCPNVSAQVLGASCAGASDGIINISVTDGVAPYSFQWNTGTTTQNIAGLSPGGYSVTVTDSLGCVAQFPAVNTIEMPLLIPDATGQSLIVPMVVDQFAADAVVTSGDDFEICVTMEHSWLRDLAIGLRCPDGTKIILHDHPGNVGGEVFMGEPIDNDNDVAIPGTGYQYCWKSTSISGTILQNIKGGLQTLPAGTYSAYESFDNFIGCPLNGTWSLEIEDTWGNDNGFVFEWHLLINDNNVELLTVRDSEVDCADCQENFHCMQWLRDTISHNVDLYDWVEKANWNGRTVFLASHGNSDDGGYTSFFDCSGNLFQTFYAGFVQTYFPNPPFVTFEALTERQFIWSDAVVLADCGAALSVENTSTTGVSCFGENDGMACAAALGGLPPYTFLWEDGNGFTLEGECIANIPAGVYSLTAIDANQVQTESVAVEIQHPNEIVINIQLMPDSENQSCVPFINISGGVAPFSISWTPEVVTDEILVSVEDANGCTSEATATCVVNGIHEIAGLEYLSLSPNPTDGLFYFTAGFSTYKTVELKVRNVTGQVVLSREVSGKSLEERLDLGGQSGGMYFVEMISEGKRVVEKLVLVK